MVSKLEDTKFRKFTKNSLLVINSNEITVKENALCAAEVFKLLDILLIQLCSSLNCLIRAITMYIDRDIIDIAIGE